MGKMFGIVLLVVAIWATAEVYNEGTSRAFGGLLVRSGIVEEAADPTTAAGLGRRAGTKVDTAHAEADERRKRMLGD